MSQNLTRWLEIATAKLRPQHARRVYTEVEAHYHDAVSDYLSQGKTQPEAEQAALADLGDPQATGRALRRAYHTRRTTLQRFALRLFGGRLDFGNLLLLMLLGLGAVWLVPSTGLPAGFDGDLTQSTMQALLLQTAICTLALSLPLFFGDLDLSLGAVVMMGALIVRLPGDIQGDIWLTPVALQPALILAGALGMGIGLLHGLLAITLRAPTAKITLITGFILALILSTFKQIEHLALNVTSRLTLYQPTLRLLLAVAALTIVAAIAASRFKPMTDRANQPILGQQKPDRTWRDSVLLWGGAFLLLLLSVIVVTTVRPDASSRGFLKTFLVISAIIATLKIALSLSWINEPLAQQLQYAKTRLGRLLTVAIMLIPPITLMSTFNGAGPFSYFIYPPASFMIAAIVIVAAFVLRSPARLWLTIPVRPAFRGQPVGLVLARIAALTLCSTLAAIVGVLMCAQGIRDNTYLLCASYFVLVPLSGLIVGGQHLLQGWKRPLGAIFGALVAGAICLGSTQPSDNLAPGGVIGIILAALAAIGWGGAAGLRAAAQHILRQQTLAEDEPEAEPSWREARAG